jgi:hypothetical protein
MMAVPEIVICFVMDVLFLFRVPGTINGSAAAACKNKQYQQSYKTGYLVFHMN